MATQQVHAFEDLRNTLGVCLRVLRQRWRLALIGLSVVGSAAFWSSQYLPREYTAATLFERRDDVVLQNLIQGNSPYSFGHLKSTLALDMIGSRALARAAVTTGLLPAGAITGEGPLSDNERAALDDMLGRCALRPTVTLLQSSASLDTIQLQCTANSPLIARRFAIALRDNYIADTRERIWRILVSSRDFFQSELARLQREVGAMEQNLRCDMDAFPGLDPSDALAVGGRLEASRAERAAAQQRKAELEAQIAAREEFLVMAPAYYANQGDPSDALTTGLAPFTQHPADAALEDQVATIKAQLVDLVAGRRMTLEHPEVKRLVGKLEGLEDLRRTLAMQAADTDPPSSQPARRLSAAEREWQSQKMRIEMELDSLRRQLDTAAQRCEDAGTRVTQLESLYARLLQNGDELRRLRERRTDRNLEIGLWQSHLASLQRILTAESGERGTQFSLIEEPKDVALPSRPRVSSVFLVCSGLGLAVGALIVGLAELFDRSFRSMGQVTRALGIPVLACVGVIPTPRERWCAARSRLVWIPTVALLLGLFLTTAGLAYASLARPDVHQRAMQRMDRMLNAVGLAAVLPPGDRSS
jgi:hypothetical protein